MIVATAVVIPAKEAIHEATLLNDPPEPPSSCALTGHSPFLISFITCGSHTWAAGHDELLRLSLGIDIADVASCGCTATVSHTPRADLAPLVETPSTNGWITGNRLRNDIYP
jgi:hypothetical protein